MMSCGVGAESASPGQTFFPPGKSSSRSSTPKQGGNKERQTKLLKQACNKQNNKAPPGASYLHLLPARLGVNLAMPG